MLNESIFKQNKNLIGFFILPIIPLLVYLVDTVVAGSTLSNWIMQIYKAMGFLSGDRPNNFYNHEYSRTIFTLTMVISPIGIWHWFYCSERRRFDYSGGIKGCIFVAIYPLIFLLPWMFILFFPLTLSEAPTRKELAIYGLHQNPIAFTIFIYPTLYLVLMLSGICMRYVWNYTRRNGNE